MLSNLERDNIIQFLVNYFGVNRFQLEEMSDHSLENTYEFAYSRTEMESYF
ncbi:BH0509 family protein [Niallia oryzisoli]|uniref:BH0509 family protein n=1 Tax=Niallia oryzisoli TaxID=1737571 RepID=UPI00373598BB